MRWSDDLVKEKILYAAELLKIDRLPTYQELENVYGNTALRNQIAKRGGMPHWAEVLNLPMKDCSLTQARIYEEMAIKDIKKYTGLDSIRMEEKFPYDLYTAGTIKVEVKMGHLYRNKNGTYFNTFRTRKIYPTCDLCVFYCLDNHDNIVKILIIPAEALAGKKQISVALNKSKWNKYTNQWIYFAEFTSFHEEILKIV